MRVSALVGRPRLSRPPRLRMRGGHLEQRCDLRRQTDLLVKVRVRVRERREGREGGRKRERERERG